MLAMTNLRGALLIVRAWVERGSPAPLRARIRLSKNVADGFDKTTTVTSPEAGGAVVQEFLEELLVEEQRAAGVAGSAPGSSEPEKQAEQPKHA